MPSYNKVILMGNLTRDPELKHLSSGTAVGSFGLAVNRKWRDQSSGQQKEEVTFVDCECWGATAENIAKYMAKGRPLFVEGRLKLDEWEDKETKQRRSRIKVVVESFQFVDSKKEEPPAGAGGREASRPSAGAAAARVEDMREDDIPF